MSQEFGGLLFRPASQCEPNTRADPSEEEQNNTGENRDRLFCTLLIIGCGACSPNGVASIDARIRPSARISVGQEQILL